MYTAAQKYQHVTGFVTDDILSCLLVINRKLSRGTFLKSHATGVTKNRINTMFRTNSKRDYCSKTNIILDDGLIYDKLSSTKMLTKV